jgi:hypothetical protein
MFLLIVCIAAALQAQAPAPKPDPEVKKLSVFVGHWTYEGETKPSPLGPGGKVTGEESFRMILGGFFQEHRVTGKGPSGQTQSIEIDGYDSVNKNFTYTVYIDDGTTASGVYTVTGNTLPYTGKFVAKGKQYFQRGTWVLSPDTMSYTEKSDISTDGKTWQPYTEGKSTKAPPAAKK